MYNFENEFFDWKKRSFNWTNDFTERSFSEKTNEININWTIILRTIKPGRKWKSKTRPSLFLKKGKIILCYSLACMVSFGISIFIVKMWFIFRNNKDKKTMLNYTWGFNLK